MDNFGDYLSSVIKKEDVLIPTDKQTLASKKKYEGMYEQPQFDAYSNTYGDTGLKEIDYEADITASRNEGIRNDLRAVQQSGTEKVLNSVGQGVGTFGTALASGVGALISGVAAVGAEVATGGEAKGMDIFLNNPFMKGIDDLDKYIKNDLVPTYYTKDQQDRIFSASTGTDLLNGIGFMASAFVPNAAIGKLFGSWSKMAAVAKAGKLGPILEAAEAAGKVTNLERKMLSAVATHLDKAAPIVGGVVGRIGESSMEAYQTYTQIKESLIAERDQARQEMQLDGETTNSSALLTDEEIENRATTGRNNVFGGNMALAVSDIAQYSRWFRGGGLGERLAKDGLKTVVKNRTKGEIIGELLKESAQEAGEEGFQFLLSKGAEKSAKGKSFIEGIEEASGDLFTTVEGQKSMLLGAILGGGMSSLAAAKNSKETKKQLNAMAAELTSTGDTSQRYITDPNTGKKIVNPELVKIATTFAFYEQQKEKALAQGDQDAYDIAEKMQFSHLVDSKIKAGQFDEFVDDLQNMGNSNPEEIKEMFGELPIKNGKEMSPSEVAFDKIQLAKRVKQMSEGLEKLPGMEKLGPDGLTMAKHSLFTQESLREQVKQKDQQIAAIEARAVYNPIPIENADLFEQEDNLLPQDRLELNAFQAEKQEILKKYKEISDEFKAIVAKPELAQEKANATQEANIKNAVDIGTKEIKKEGQDLANAVGKTIIVQDAEGNNIEVVVAEDVDGNFVNELTGEVLPNEVVLEQTAAPVIEVAEEDMPEFNEEFITADEEDENDNTIDEYQKKTTVNSSTGQALEVTGGEIVVVEGERVQNPKFVEQTKVFNNPTISDNVVTDPTDKPNVITFKAEIGTITEEDLNKTNARRRAKDLEPMTMEQVQNDPEFTPIVLTLMVNGKANNKVKNYYHTPDYYYSTAEYEAIEKSKDFKGNAEEIEKAKEKIHKANFERIKATRAKLVQQIKDKKSVVLLTSGKSRGVLNYNPKVDGERKTSNVIGILAKNFKELLNGLQNKFFSIEKGQEARPINTQGLKVVTAVSALENGDFVISTQSNSSKSSFVSKVEYSLGTMLFDLIAPNGEVVTTSPFTKASFSNNQKLDLAELVLEKLQGNNTIEVDGKLVTISGTESVPGILDSLMYVGVAKSRNSEAIAAQLFFTKDGRIQLGKKIYDKNTEGIYDLIKDHIFNYKTKPHFKFKSIEVFGKNFGIPVKQSNGKYKIENPTTYMEFMFGGEKTPALITTALNPTKFVNSYFKFATNNNGDLSIEGQTAKTEPVVSEPVTVTSIVTPTSIEIEEAKINKEWQDALNRVSKKLKGTKIIKTITSPFFKGFSAVSINNLIGTELKNGDIIRVTSSDKRPGKEAGAVVSTDFTVTNGKLIESGNPNFNIKTDKRKFGDLDIIEDQYEEDIAQKNKVNEYYKAKLDALKTKAKPIITPEPASEIEAKKADIERRRQKDLSKIATDIFPDTTHTEIVYRGVGQIREDNFRDGKSNDIRDWNFFTNNKSKAEDYGENVISAIINFSEVDDTYSINYKGTSSFKSEDSAFVAGQGGDEFVVKNKEQIHILSKEEQNNIDKINAKYDAEIAALEGKTEEVVEESSEEVIPTTVNEKENECNPATGAPNVKSIKDSQDISAPLEDFDW
tara:strand:+ start:1237 stop:6150 length:4914 start_codon:yes stop_codon:yes gene_type:complete